MFQRVEYSFRALQCCFQHFKKVLEHLTASCAQTFFCVLETTLSYSKTVLSALNYCLLR